MEVYYQSLVTLLPDNEHLEIIYDRDLDIINITTDNAMIHADTAATIFRYCDKHGLRCYISWSYVRNQIWLAILKNTF